jgi:hypothetical protein
MQSTVKYPGEWYTCKTFSKVDNILCYIKPGDNPANWKIALPENLISLLLSDIIRLLDIQEARGFMDSYDKATIIEIYFE